MRSSISKNRTPRTRTLQSPVPARLWEIETSHRWSSAGDLGLDLGLNTLDPCLLCAEQGFQVYAVDVLQGSGCGAEVIAHFMTA